jgi:hypothetical protein
MDALVPLRVSLSRNTNPHPTSRAAITWTVSSRIETCEKKTTVKRRETCICICICERTIAHCTPSSNSGYRFRRLGIVSRIYLRHAG